MGKLEGEEQEEEVVVGVVLVLTVVLEAWWAMLLCSAPSLTERGGRPAPSPPPRRPLERKPHSNLRNRNYKHNVNHER